MFFSHSIPQVPKVFHEFWATFLPYTRNGIHPDVLRTKSKMSVSLYSISENFLTLLDIVILFHNSAISFHEFWNTFLPYKRNEIHPDVLRTKSKMSVSLSCISKNLLTLVKIVILFYNGAINFSGILNHISSKYEKWNSSWCSSNKK